MARSHAKVLVQVWRDRDWTGHTIEAQWLYWLLLSQPKLTLVGSLEVTTGRWAAFAPNASKDVVEAALDELDQAEKVIVDDDTDELLIRTFTAHDLDQNRVNVNLAKGLWGQWACIASEHLRRLAVLLIPDETWAKLEPHAPSDALHIRTSARLEPGGSLRLRRGTRSRLEIPPSSLLPPETGNRPAAPSRSVDFEHHPAALIPEDCRQLASSELPSVRAALFKGYPAKNGETHPVQVGAVHTNGETG